jgi:hypothetical protein
MPKNAVGNAYTNVFQREIDALRKRNKFPRHAAARCPYFGNSRFATTGVR